MDTGGMLFSDMSHPPLTQPLGMTPAPPALMTHLDPMQVPAGIRHEGLTPPPEGLLPHHDGMPDFNRPATLQDFESLFQDVGLPMPSATSGFTQDRGPMF